MLLHDSEELDDDLGGRSDHNLSLTSLLGVGNGLKGVSENGGSSHFAVVSKRRPQEYPEGFHVACCTGQRHTRSVVVAISRC